MALVIDPRVQKEKNREKSRNLLRKLQHTSLPQRRLLSFHSVFLSLGSLRRNNSSFGPSGFDPWLTVVCLLWGTGRLQREVGESCVDDWKGK